MMIIIITIISIIALTHPTRPRRGPARQCSNSNVRAHECDVENHGCEDHKEYFPLCEASISESDDGPDDSTGDDAEDGAVAARGCSFADDVDDVEDYGDNGGEELEDTQGLEDLGRELVFDFLLIGVEHCAIVSGCKIRWEGTPVSECSIRWTIVRFNIAGYGGGLLRWVAGFCAQS